MAPGGSAYFYIIGTERTDMRNRIESSIVIMIKVSLNIFLFTEIFFTKTSYSVAIVFIDTRLLLVSPPKAFLNNLAILYLKNKLIQQVMRDAVNKSNLF